MSYKCVMRGHDWRTLVVDYQGPLPSADEHRALHGKAKVVNSDGERGPSRIKRTEIFPIDNIGGSYWVDTLYRSCYRCGHRSTCASKRKAVSNDPEHRWVVEGKLPEVY